MSTAERRGRVTVWVVIALVLAAATIGILVLISRSQTGILGVGGSEPESPSPSPPPPECPLTGAMPEGNVPVRPALAVKVENLPASRPQTGMSWADIVYEEPVEAMITRFIAIYQCQDASRIEPVRSARHTDADILAQFGRPLFAYAGAVQEVVRALHRAGIVDMNYDRFPHAYHRDPQRQAPHNLYTSTEELYASMPKRKAGRVPEPVFLYEKKRPNAPTVSSIHIPFSSYSDVYWKWEPVEGSQRRFVRYHGTEAHVYSDGTPVTTTNVVVQMVDIKLTEVIDAAGARSPRVISVGDGKAYVLRNGRIIEGRWKRDSAADVTRFVDEDGDEIPLRPGQTWVELVPNDVVVEFS